jgi:hypothetical protein
VLRADYIELEEDFNISLGSFNTLVQIEPETPFKSSTAEPRPAQPRRTMSHLASHRFESG